MKTLKRSDATDILDIIRVMLAEGKTPTDIEKCLEITFGIEPLQHCDGEAHSNAFIDACSVCTPRWGFIGEKIKIT